MSNIISVTDFRSHVSDVVNRVHYKNETIFLTRGSTVVAKIVGLAPTYPYARQIKAARLEAGNFVQAAVADLAKHIVSSAKQIGAFIKFLAGKTWEFTLLLTELFKRWVGICLVAEKESWMGGATGAKRRRAAQ